MDAAARDLCKLYTPDAVSKAIVEALPIQKGDWVHEPHAGGGSFLRALEKKDVHLTFGDYAPDAGVTCRGASVPQVDFLQWPKGGEFNGRGPQWIIGNPPYITAEEHIRHACKMTGRHVVFVLRLAMLEGAGRAVGLWKDTPLREVIVLAPRPSFTADGRTDTKTAYAAFWWDKQWSLSPQIRWLKWR